MITAQGFIEKVSSAGLFHSATYAYPVLAINLVSEKFDPDDFEGNVEVVAESTDLSIEDAYGAMSNSLIAARCFRSASEIPPSDDAVDHWMALLMGKRLASKLDNNGRIRSFHFYGYKGGQARSTTLAITAKRLADMGRHVLIIDADIEAPSLHILFDTAVPRVSGSLMGACDASVEVNPTSVYTGSQNGRVDLLGCRPSGDEYDLDFQAFALNSSLDPSLLRRGFGRIKNLAEVSGRWDFVFVDHRTGIAPSVVPILSAFPGSAVITLRPDLLSTPALKISKSLLEAYPQFPGAFVCFSLDPEERKELSPREQLLRERFLKVLAGVIESSSGAADDDEGVDPSTLEHSYINWYFDRAFIDQQLPDYGRLSKDNQDAISDLIQILGLDQEAERIVEHLPVEDLLTPRVPSGASDSGWFIETREIAKLMQASSAFSYIFGRKGTGKTRIYREMHRRGRGIPVLAAADYAHGGLKAQSLTSFSLLANANYDFELFWWNLVEIALSKLDGLNDTEIEKLVESNGRKAFNPSRIKDLVRGLSDQVTLLIDGVETAVSSRDTKRFVESLFRVLSTIQNDPGFNEKVQFKLFIRPDLSVGIQNVEQQTAGRKLELRWDEASIFNYMLAEIGRKDWFNRQFPGACSEIASKQSLIKEGLLDQEDYERILLSIFPVKIRRNNLLTMTFFRTYFSDSVSDSADSRSSFYPRVVGSFLDHVEKICQNNVASSIEPAGRVSHSILLQAFELATDEFIDEIKQELYFALELNSDPVENQRMVNDMLASLAGQQTPFFLDSCIENLQDRMSESLVGDRALRDAFRQMKDMGIFETHPVDSTKWRAGRLFKEALGMKYVR